MTAPMLLCLLAPTTVFVEIRGVLAEEQRVYPRGWSSPAAAVAAERVTAIAYDQDQGLSVAKVYQWFLPDTRFVVFDGARQAPPLRVVITARGGPRRRPDAPATILWRDPARDQELQRYSPG
jgi:hypothetical protein